MNLYEIVTGYFGSSYERCYVWAATRERAVQLFESTYNDRKVSDVICLMSRECEEFITKLDSEGWER